MTDLPFASLLAAGLLVAGPVVADSFGTAPLTLVQPSRPAGTAGIVVARPVALGQLAMPSAGQRQVSVTAEMPVAHPVPPDRPAGLP
ncbi:hypothetical protein [Azonexus sp.]|jgi:hypothetical protein|uniref:hypothetical protein n=1 Tax=Azonexus sp. TaxID=1872668 RepID=UPI00282A5A5E|nr:hypothetical protein [Azonexus sp.]MDR1994884.1 hypothetical protein [Azonexus sp.]